MQRAGACVQRVAMRRLRSGGGQRALLVGAGGTAKAAMYALSKVKGIQRPVLIFNRTTARAEALAAEFGAQVVTSLEGLENVGVIVSTIPPEGASVIPDSLLASRPIMLDASYMPGGAPLTQRATAAGCDLIVGPHMLFEQATYQVTVPAPAPAHNPAFLPLPFLILPLVSLINLVALLCACT